MQPELHKKLENNLKNTLELAICYEKSLPVLLIYDEQSPFSIFLANAYKKVIPGLHSLHFEKSNPEEIMKEIDSLPPSSLVILVQSTSFRLNEFRFRIELFKRNLKVVEHVHLLRITEEEFPTFIDSLAYDINYYRSLGPALKKKIDVCKKITLIGENTQLIYDSIFEDSKLNIGDYSGMKNVGGQFPIGEVFSEPKNLTQVNGSIELFAFAGNDYDVDVPEKPFKIKIENGLVTDISGSPPAFQNTYQKIAEHEGKVWIRELGFGLNRAFTKERRVSDIGAYERMCGIHISMGAKHAMYTKEGFPKKQCKFHVDIFPDVKKVLIDEEVVFEDGKYCTPRNGSN